MIYSKKKLTGRKNGVFLTLCVPYPYIAQAPAAKIIGKISLFCGIEEGIFIYICTFRISYWHSKSFGPTAVVSSNNPTTWRLARGLFIPQPFSGASAPNLGKPLMFNLRADPPMVDTGKIQTVSNTIINSR